MLKLVKYPNKILTVPCKEEILFDLRLHKQIEEMHKAVVEFHGFALAANQVGFNNRVFVVAESPRLIEGYENLNNEPLEFRWPKVVINPEIIDPQGETKYKESCLSIPDVSAWNKRHKSFILKYKDEFGAMHQTLANGLFAIVCQHEIDHLDGKLFVDSLDFFEKSKIQKKLNKLRK